MDYSKIPVVLLFIISMLACCAGGFAKAYYSKRITSSAKDYNLFNGAISIISAILLFVLGGFDTGLSSYTLMMGVLFGVITMLNTILTSIAINLGPLSYTYVIIYSSTIVTALSGYLFWGEDLTMLKVIGIILMFMCCVLAKQKESNNKKATAKWLVVCILNAFTSAGVGLMQKTHQSSAYKEELSMFLVITFLVSALTSVLLYIITSIKKKNFALEYKGDLNIKKLACAVGIIFVVTGIGVAINNGFNLYLSGVVDSAIFFPIVNGGIIMFNILVSFFFFREKLSGTQWLGLMLGISAIGCLCIKI